MQPDSNTEVPTARILTESEVKAKSSSNLRLAWILGLVALGFFVSAWFIDIS